MELVHYVNSMQFYWSTGVEWASTEEPLHLIEDLEKIVDEAISILEFPLVCAYEGNRMPEFLKKSLMETHPYILLEDDFIVSNQYNPTQKVK